MAHFTRIDGEISTWSIGFGYEPKKSLESIFQKNLSGNGPYLCRKKHVHFAQIESKKYSLRKKKKHYSSLGKKQLSRKKKSEEKNIPRECWFGMWIDFQVKVIRWKNIFFFCWERNDFFFQIERKLLCVCKLGICNTKVNCFVADNEAN